MKTDEATASESIKLQLDRSLRCVACTSEKAGPFGISAASLLGKYFPDLLVSAEEPMIVETLRGVVEDWTRAVIVASFEEADRCRWIELDVVPVEAGTEDDAVLEIELRDVTDRVEEEKDRKSTPLAQT